MWSPNWNAVFSVRHHRLTPAFIALIALSLLVVGCQVRPLYGTAGVAGSQIQLELETIDIASADDSRVDQVLRNELNFLLRGGSARGAIRYELNILLTKKQQRVAVEEFEDVPNAFFVELVATYTLRDLETRKTLLTGTSFSNSSYDFSSQRFANIRAERDAEDRAAGVIAVDIRTRLASYFAQRTEPTTELQP